MKKNKGIKFVIVGIGNTVLDFGLMNIFSLVLPTPIPNFLSTGIAMLSSFYFNKKWTFDSHSKSRKELRREIVLFFIFTIIGIWVIQTPLMYLISNSIPHSIHGFIAMRIGTHWANFIIINFAKVIASVFSMTWNFITYKQIVFRNQTKADQSVESSGL